MIRSTINISQVKDAIKNMQDSAVSVTLNLGRNKFISYTGVVKGVYPALFTVLPDDKGFKGKTSYSYSEYMCGKVRLNKTKKEVK